MTKVEQHVTYTVTKTLHPDEVSQLRADVDAMYQRKVHPTARAFLREIIEAVDDTGHGAQVEPEESEHMTPVPLPAGYVSGDRPVQVGTVHINEAHPDATREDVEPPLPIPAGAEAEAGLLPDVPVIPGMKTKADALNAQRQ